MLDRVDGIGGFITRRTAVFVIAHLALWPISCALAPEEGVSPQAKPAVLDAKKLTVYLLDASGSFNRQQKGGLFDGQNYFDLACDQVRHHLQDASAKEVIFAYSISSSSQGDDNLGLSLDLTEFAKEYSVPEPTNIFQHRDWEKGKAEFDQPLRVKMDKARAAAVEKLEQFRKDHSARPADHTDLYTAIWLASEVFGDPTYKGGESQLIIFSDFQDTRTNTTPPVQLPGVKVVGKFVSRNGHTRETYDALLDRWRHVLVAQSLELLPPERSN